MPVFYKDGSVWKPVDSLQVNVSGTWKPVRTAYVKVSNAWKKFYQLAYIPAGGIIMYASTGAAPTNWSDYLTGAKWLRAWNSGDIEDIGGSRAVQFTSHWEAAHDGSSYGGFNARGHNIAGSVEQSIVSNNLVQGGHSHDITLGGECYPYRFDARLIQADSDQESIPPYGVCFADRTLSGMTQVNVSDCAACVSNLGGAVGSAVKTPSFASISTEMSHRHHNLGADYAYAANPTNIVEAGSHTHSGWSINDLTWEMYRIVLKAFYNVSAAIPPKAGMIIGWPSATAPPGYVFCNGNNGTIDLRDYYISIDSSLTPGSTKGTGKAQFNYSCSNWAHEHAGATASLKFFKTGYHKNNFTHNHEGYRGIEWEYNYVKLAFIQWVG